MHGVVSSSLWISIGIRGSFFDVGGSSLHELFEARLEGFMIYWFFWSTLNIDGYIAWSLALTRESGRGWDSGTGRLVRKRLSMSTLAITSFRR